MVLWFLFIGVVFCLFFFFEFGLFKVNEMVKMMGIFFMIFWCYLRFFFSRDVFVGFKEGNRFVVRGFWRGCLWGNSWYVLVFEYGF